MRSLCVDCVVEEFLEHGRVGRQGDGGLDQLRVGVGKVNYGEHGDQEADSHIDLR